MINNSTDLPVYCIWDVVGQGVVGGKITSPNFQGETTAKMAMKILDGEDIAHMSVRGSPMIYKFDYRQLVRLDIDLEKLPPNRKIINEPFSFYKTYRNLVHGTLIFIFILILFLFVFCQDRGP